MSTPEPDRSRTHAAYEAVVERLVALGNPDTAETARPLHRVYRAEVAYFIEIRAALMPATAATLVTAGGSHAERR